MAQEVGDMKDLQVLRPRQGALRRTLLILLQDANDRVEHGTHEAEMHADAGWTATGAQMKREALAVCDVAVESADNLRGEIRAHPLLAVFTGIVVGVLLGRALR